MIFHNLLIPYDKSVQADHALDLALKMIAENQDGEPVTLNISMVSSDIPEFDDATYAASAARIGLPENSVENLQKIRETIIDDVLEDLKDAVTDRLADTDAQVVFSILQGKPDHALIRFAEEQGCEMIIMGSRGLGGVRGMIGSVSYGVLRQAEIPVLIVK